MRKMLYVATQQCSLILSFIGISVTVCDYDPTELDHYIEDFGVRSSTRLIEYGYCKTADNFVLKIDLENLARMYRLCNTDPYKDLKINLLCETIVDKFGDIYPWFTREIFITLGGS